MGARFHLGASPEMARTWFAQDSSLDEIMTPYDRRGPELLAQGMRVFANFVALAGAR